MKNKSDIALNPIVVNGWPLVDVCFQGAAGEDQVLQWLCVMNQLLQRQQPFGLLTKTKRESDFSDLARKAMGLWFKQQKESIGLWCVGVSRVAMDEQAVERLAGPKMQAAMPCPIFASTDETCAREWIKEKLSSRVISAKPNRF